MLSPDDKNTTFPPAPLHVYKHPKLGALFDMHALHLYAIRFADQLGVLASGANAQAAIRSAAPALQVIDAPRVEDDELISMEQVKSIQDSIKWADGWNGQDWDFALAKAVAAHVACQAQPTDRDAALVEIEEGAQILRDLIASIEKYGNYSKEATLSFLGQLKQCIDGAAEELKSGGSTTEGAAHG